ncbi:hypothetical protein G7Y79_00073g098060 [Physcia stellaris]|nr:hypothetical protein G7Y79_00073g098060 [Physcia stellaris]
MTGQSEVEWDTADHLSICRNTIRASAVTQESSIDGWNDWLRIFARNRKAFRLPFYSRPTQQLSWSATMYLAFLVVILNLSNTVAQSLAIALSSAVVAQTPSVLPISLNSSALGFSPRPALPYHVQVGETDISVQIMQYYPLMDPHKLCSCIIFALIEIYEYALYDHGNAPVRGDIYSISLDGIILDFQKYTARRGARLTYMAVVRALQALQIFAHQYGSFGMELIVYELGVQVGHAEIRRVLEHSTKE